MEFFANPWFMAAGGALISSPILIHLINRMRFKRIRWAAMEFLLKAQKRTRRRLIIEQLLLLALRCLMIALVGFLVSRFIGCGDGGIGGKPNLHLVLFDDTPSMQEHWKEGEINNCVDVAKSEILTRRIAKELAKGRSTDQLMILPLSRVNDPSLELASITYERLNDDKNQKKLLEDITELKGSLVHVDLMEGIKKAKTIIDQYSQSHVTFHIVSDYRDADWGGKQGDALVKELVALAAVKKGEIKIHCVDTVLPARAKGQASPTSRDNVGIVEVRPSTRIVGKNMPVQFTVKIRNFGTGVRDVSLMVRDEKEGKDLFDVNFNPTVPLNIVGDEATVTFERRFNPDMKPNEPYFAHLSVRLVNAQLGQLENDALLVDNIRHTFVEVRDKVPILVIDGDIKGKEDGKDSFFISRSLQSVPGASYQVVYGDELSPRNPVEALERPDLNKFPTIFLLNVPMLKPKQIEGLENYVKDGGGVAFFLGPLVQGPDYNRFLYKDGKGVFPAPLKNPYFPGPNDPPLAEKAGEGYQLIIREEKFKGRDEKVNNPTPIFGPIFEDEKSKAPLGHLPIRRYWQVARSQWKEEPEKVFELATLPNDAAATTYQDRVAEILINGESIKAILANKDFGKYQLGLTRRINNVRNAVQPGSEAKAYQLANDIFMLLNDKGSAKAKDTQPDLFEFWSNSDLNVQTVKEQLNALRDDVLYGDPYIVVKRHAKGKVVAVMSTAGKDWNDFAGGSAASILYAPFIWELQNYLSSQGSEGNLSTGTRIPITLDAAPFKGASLKLNRYFMKTEVGKNAVKSVHVSTFLEERDGKYAIELQKHNVPGLYLTEVVDENAPAKGPIASWGHVFNVDTMAEGNLSRVGSARLEDPFDKSENPPVLSGPDSRETNLVSKLNDFSASPWLFLIMLLVLVAEQALAVHLSFHMKNAENEFTAAGATRATV
jgi:aerotolerance regulator-like protein